MQQQNTRAIVITAVVAICAAVLMSAYFTRNKKETRESILKKDSIDMMKGMDTQSMPPPLPVTSKKKENTKAKKGGWANSMLPFYSIGILAYIMFIVGKIMTKKNSNAKKSSQIKFNWSSQKRLKKGNSKTKITMHELRQLEDKLHETEEAMQEIFSRASFAMNATQNMINNSSDDDDLITSEEQRFHDTHPDASKRKGKSDAKKRLRISDSSDGADDARVRRVRAKRKVRNNATSIKTPATTSESDCEHLLQKKRSRRFHYKSQEEEESTSHHQNKLEALNSLVAGNNARSEKELLKTTKDIRKTMTELQSYLDEKKANLLEE